MRNILIAIILFAFPYGTLSQDLQRYINTLEGIAEKVPAQIHEKGDCDELIRDLDDLSDDLEEALKDTHEMHPEDFKNLKTALRYADVLENFLRAVGNSSYITWYLKESDIRLAKELVNFELAQVHSGKFCVNIYELSMGAYTCLLVYKKGGNDILNIKAQIASNQGRSLNKVDMGLTSNQYRRLWSNGDKLTVKDYNITEIKCSIIGSNTFGF